MQHFHPTSWTEFALFQMEIANRWLSRGNESNDVFARFFFYFAGLNALYYLWAQVDGIKGKEIDSVVNLASKLGGDAADRVVGQLTESMEYFRRREPIQNMRHRTADDPSTGSTDSLRVSAHRALAEPDAAQRLRGLVQTIYFVRSNLVHGSKSTSGDDQELVTRSILPLRVFLEEVLRQAESAFHI